MLEVKELDLMCRIRAASTLEDICNLGYELFGNPLHVEDLGHIVLAHTDSSHFDLSCWTDQLEGAAPSLTQQKEWRLLLDRLIQSVRPVLVEGAQPSDARLMRILMYRGQPVGIAVLAALMRPLREEDGYILDLIADKMAECLARGSFVLTGNQWEITNLFIQLLNNDNLSRRQAAQRMSVQYWTKKQHFWVVLLSDATGLPYFSYEELRDPAVFRGNIAFPYQNYWVCIWRADHDMDLEQEPEIQELIHSGKYYIGISRSFRQPQMVQPHYGEAAEAIRLGLDMKLYPARRCVNYGEIAFYHMLFMTSPNCNLLSFCERKVLDLDQYDKRHKTDLLYTLQIYLDCCKDMNATAAAIGMHKNTVRYRINKCMELMGTDLENGAEIFNVLFSIRVLNYCRTLNRIPTDPDMDY